MNIFISLSTLLILQIIGTEAFQTSADAINYNQSAIQPNFRYAANFEQAGPLQRYKKHSPGPTPRGNFIVHPPTAGSYSIIHHTTSKRRRQPVRIATKNSRSPLSNGYTPRKDSVNSSKHSQPNFPVKAPQAVDKNRSKLLTNEVFTRSPVSRVVVRKRKNKNKPVDKGIAKLISSTSRLVSNDDVVNINGAAEEYFDDISEEQVNNSLIDFGEKHLRQGHISSLASRHHGEIITNNLFHPSSRSLQADESKVLTSSIRVDGAPHSSQTSAPEIAVEISNTNNRPYDFGDRIASQYLGVSTEANILSSATEGSSSTLSYSLPDNITEHLNSDEFRTTKSDQTVGKATTISEAFLAPLQAGYLLYSDDSIDANTNELEDNVLSDSIQNDQAVVNNIRTENKTTTLQSGTVKSEDETVGNQLATVVESYRSSPVVEIVEKSVDGSTAGKFTEQTYFYSPIRHTDSERPTIPVNIRTPATQLNLNEPRVTTEPTTLNANSILWKPTPETHVGPLAFPPQLQFPVPSLGHNFGVPIRHPTGANPIPLQVSYRTPQNAFFFMQTLHNPLGKFTPKVVKDDYWGPVPPINEHSIWSTMHVRQQRQLSDVGIPRMEYGFKPLMRPSLEINEDGLPIAGN